MLSSSSYPNEPGPSRGSSPTSSSHFQYGTHPYGRGRDYVTVLPAMNTQEDLMQDEALGSRVRLRVPQHDERRAVSNSAATGYGCDYGHGRGHARNRPRSEWSHFDDIDADSQRPITTQRRRDPSPTRTGNTSTVATTQPRSNSRSSETDGAMSRLAKAVKRFLKSTVHMLVQPGWIRRRKAREREKSFLL